ncbi:hypothetical protein BC629DRAFT_1435304 [Irpex lacteus]|nr:hypothetical protein BC629DRAFT_1435304 [Irpex lacteus]
MPGSRHSLACTWFKLSSVLEATWVAVCIDHSADEKVLMPIPEIIPKLCSGNQRCVGMIEAESRKCRIEEAGLRSIRYALITGFPSHVAPPGYSHKNALSATHDISLMLLQSESRISLVQNFFSFRRDSKQSSAMLVGQRVESVWLEASELVAHGIGHAWQLASFVDSSFYDIFTTSHAPRAIQQAKRSAAKGTVQYPPAMRM